MWAAGSQVNGIDGGWFLVRVLVQVPALLEFTFVCRDQPPQDVLGHLKAGAGTEKNGGAEPGQCVDQRMYSPPVFQVSPQSNPESPDSSSFFSDGVEVAQSLGGMFVTPVTGIYHRNTSVIGEHSGCSFPWMPDDNYIGIAPNHFRHISNAFTFGQRACPYVHRSYDATPESEHPSFKRQPRSCAWLKKQARHDLPLA